jgi:hypothetical protein
MMMMMTRMTIAGIAIVLCAWSCSPTGSLNKPDLEPMDGSGIEAIPDVNGTRGEVSLTLARRPPQESEGSDPKEPAPAAQAWEQIELLLANRSGERITFRGYNETQPWYRIQRLVDGKWQNHRVGWFCGTGLRQCEITAGKSTLIPVSVRKDIYPVRIGVDYGLGSSENEDRTVWSAQIEAR